MKYSSGLILVTLLLLGCGSGDDDAGTPVAAPQMIQTAVPAATAPVLLPSPTPYRGSIPQPVVVRVTSTVIPKAEAVVVDSTPTLPPEQAVVVSVGTPESPAVPPVSMDCGSFDSHREAQAFFLDQGEGADVSELDTNNDGIACNSPGDRGYADMTFESLLQATATPFATVTATVPKRDCADFETWEEANAFFVSEGGPRSDPHNLDGDRDGVPCTALKYDEENPPEPTPTLPPPEASDDAWSSEGRTTELNAINWRAFIATSLGGGRWSENGVFGIAAPGEIINSNIRDEDGNPSRFTAQVDCAERFGNRFDERNTSFYEELDRVWIWIEPADGSEPFCARVDRYRNWLPSDPEPLPSAWRWSALPQAERLDALVFTDSVNGPREHTLPPSNLSNLELSAMGKTVEVREGDGKLECTPQKAPVAVWTRGMGFEVLSREEEELLARGAFAGTRDEGEQERFWQSYDWERKEYWRNEGWFLAILGDPYDRTVRDNRHWLNDVIYGVPVLASCWLVWNVEDLPESRYCLECERRANMERMAADAQ